MLVLGPRKRRVLLPSSTHRNTRKVPFRYPKCFVISEGILYFTAFCGLLEHLNLKDRREQQTEIEHYQKMWCGAGGELVKRWFWFVCLLLQTDENNSLYLFSGSS